MSRDGYLPPGCTQREIDEALQGAEPDIPADVERHPFGCPDPEWCRGNRCCYWDCRADPDADPEEVE